MVRKEDIITLEELRAQMRIDEFSDEGELLRLYGDAATDVVISATNRTLDELLDIGFSEHYGKERTTEERRASDFPNRLKIAALILAAHFYRNREPVASVAQNEVPFTLRQLINAYVRLSNR